MRHLYNGPFCCYAVTVTNRGRKNTKTESTANDKLILSYGKSLRSWLLRADGDGDTKSDAAQQ